MSRYSYSDKSASFLYRVLTLGIVVDVAAALFVISAIFYLPYIPLWVRLLISAIMIAIAVPTIWYFNRRRQVVQAPLADKSLARAVIEVTPEALLLSSGARAFSYPWDSIGSVCTNAEHYGGKMDALVAQKALVLSPHPLDGKAPGAIRRAIATAALNSAWEPVEVGEMTVLPMRYLKGSWLDLVRDAKTAHAKAGRF